jgi:hypothetical protein
MECPEPQAPDIAGHGRGDPALVVFADESGLKCLRCLRRGFRHCFIAVCSARGWVVCDPLSHQTDLSIVDGFSPPELAAWYREYGLVVVETHLRLALLRPAPLRPFTCVEMVKRVLGLNAPWVLTPWQLYRLLRAREHEAIAWKGELTYLPRRRRAHRIRNLTIFLLSGITALTCLVRARIR